ncbi:hypothetical protein [Actinoplanes sp. N902-109]|nr:hypothetical protein [Actinoplanes sp. N902-109]AGL19260.1 hypothetical protein L083_5750 [Actinoplanes sp. N902-109]
MTAASSRVAAESKMAAISDLPRRIEDVSDAAWLHYVMQRAAVANL